MIRRCRWIWAGLGAVIAGSTAIAQVAVPDLVQNWRVERVHQDARIASFARSPTDRVALGDRLVHLAGDGRAAIGRVILIDEGHFAAKFGFGPLPAPEDELSAVAADAPIRMRPWLPDGATLWARVDAIAASASTPTTAPAATSPAVWLDRGLRDGLRPGDRLLAVRRGLPLMRLELDTVHPAAALATAVPLVADAHLVPGDLARLWPAPQAAPGGGWQTSVLIVREVDNAIEAWLPGDRADGLTLGDRWEITRDGEYVDLVEITEFRPRFAIARGGQAFARSRIRIGDSALRRTTEGIASRRSAMRVFRLEGRYCLLNAGENDNIAEGQRVAVVLPDGALTWLVVETVKIDYCGARQVNTTDEPTPASAPIGDVQAPRGHAVSQPADRPAHPLRSAPLEIPLWAEAFLGEPAPATRVVGRIDRLLDDREFALVRLSNGVPTPGQILRLEAPRAEPPDGSLPAASRPIDLRAGRPAVAAGLVVAVEKGWCALFVPRGGHVNDVGADWNAIQDSSAP